MGGMEHHFSKREYFANCAFTIFFSGLVAASYFDISTCPYRYDRGTPLSVVGSKSNGVGVGGCSYGSSSSGASGNGGMASPRSLFTSLRREGGIACHMADLVIWVYIISLVLFMSYKYYYYRIRGLHYFLLDYCYFHNACLVLFLLWRLVDVQWSEEPLFSWDAYLPQSWRDDPDRNNLSTDGVSMAAIAVGATPLVNQTWNSWVRQRIPLTGRQMLLVAGIYKPVSVDIITIGHAAAEVSSADELLLNFLSFFTLVAGSFGPILGAVVVWKNALLFHSLDRMSSSYLHLAPAVTQVLLLHRLFTTARKELSLFDATLGEDRDAQRHLATLCEEGTLCHDLQHAVLYWTLLKLHFAMFIVWQVLYHTFNESRRRSRAKSNRKRLKELARRQEEFCRLTGATPEEAQLLRPIILLSEGLRGDPMQRVTAYTWMFEHPPLGKEGVLYRFVTMFGTGYLPTVVMFQVTQWMLHVVFFTMAYPALYHSFHVALSAWPLVLYVTIFVLVCVYNAAVMNKKWIQKLQALADIGMEMRRQREAAISAAPEETNENRNETIKTPKKKKTIA